MKYRILFLGLGSIGTRHLLNVVQYCNDVNAEFVIDAVRNDTKKKLDDQIARYIRKQYSYLDSITEHYDIAFITNPTYRHFVTLEKYISCVEHFFIEKPVFSECNIDIGKLSLHPNGIYYVACPLRYTKVLQYVKNNIDCTTALAVRAISSSYLPDWRPGTDYRKTYSANNSMGGGVAIDLIHEWDYLCWLFGEPSSVVSIQSKVSNLEITSNDIAIYIGKNEHLTYEVHLDYYGRKTIRELQILMPEETIIADIANGVIKYLCADYEIKLSEDRNEYQMQEIRHFFECIQGKCLNDNSIENAYKVLKIGSGNMKSERIV